MERQETLKQQFEMIQTRIIAKLEVKKDTDENKVTHASPGLTGQATNEPPTKQ